MSVLRRSAALLTLGLLLETTLLGSPLSCLAPGGDDISAMAGMDDAGMNMSGMDMTPAQEPGEGNSGSDTSCSLPWSPPRDCHDMQACAPPAIAAPAVTLTVAVPIANAALPRLVPEPHSLAHTPDPPPPRI